MSKTPTYVHNCAKGTANIIHTYRHTVLSLTLFE